MLVYQEGDMEPENEALEEDIPGKRAIMFKSFSVSILVFGVYQLEIKRCLADLKKWELFNLGCLPFQY